MLRFFIFNAHVSKIIVFKHHCQNHLFYAKYRLIFFAKVEFLLAMLAQKNGLSYFKPIKILLSLVTYVVGFPCLSRNKSLLSSF